jgi:hypothetical protein
MQPARRSRGLAASLLVLLALVTVACGVTPMASGPPPSPAVSGVPAEAVPTTPLLTVESRGGECMDGPCGSTVIVDRDGTVRSADKPPNVLGTIPAAQMAALDAAIKLTDFALLKSRPFTGECPTNFDGQEFIFEFAAPGGTERIATCEVQVDYALPLFVAVSTALGPFTPLPTN